MTNWIPFPEETKELTHLEALIEKIAFLLHPEKFLILFPHCFWYWVVFTLVVIVVLRKR